MTNGSCNEVCILAVGSVPVASIEDADYVVVYGWEGFEKTDKSMFVVDLVFGRWFSSQYYLMSGNAIKEKKKRRTQKRE